LVDQTLDLRLLVQPAAGEKASLAPDGSGGASLGLSGPWALPSVRREPAGDPTAR
jgi:hypothetical protein